MGLISRVSSRTYREAIMSENILNYTQLTEASSQGTVLSESVLSELSAPSTISSVSSNISITIADEDAKNNNPNAPIRKKSTLLDVEQHLSITSVSPIKAENANLLHDTPAQDALDSALFTPEPPKRKRVKLDARLNDTIDYCALERIPTADIYQPETGVYRVNSNEINNFSQRSLVESTPIVKPLRDMSLEEISKQPQSPPVKRASSK